MKVLVLLVALLGVACRDTGQHPNDQEARVAALATSVDAFDTELRAVEVQARRLSSELSEIADAYASVAARYQAAQRQRSLAKESSRAASRELQQASSDWQKAEASWRFYQQVIKIAISIDQARSTSAGTQRQSFSCETVSTASFRRTLIAQGVSLIGKDIDHIVPKALGGADHPSNYQVLDSSLNRSLGKTWNVEKCAIAGDARCAEAVAVSSKCGNYRGGF